MIPETKEAASRALLNTTATTSERVQAAEKIINEYLSCNLPNITEIGKMVGMSSSSLKRNFRQVYGQPLYDYYLFQKMQKAKKIIAEGKLGVAATAFEVGYEKVSNFIFMFKKHNGISPGTLKKQIDKASR